MADTDNAERYLAADNVARYMEADRIIKEQEAIKKEIKVLLSGLLVKEDTAPGANWAYDGVGAVVYVKGRESSKIDPKLLLRNGVTADVIKQCTVKSTGVPHLRVEPIKE